jgi:seryl-tRNA synthetase
MTHEHTITLERPLNPDLADEFARRVYFASGDIVGFEFVSEPAGVTGVVVRTDTAVPTEDLARKLGVVLRNDVLSQLAREPKVVWRSAATRPVPAGTFDALVAAGTAFESGEGQIALGEPLLGLMDGVDRLVRDVVVGEMAGREYRYPTLISAAALHRCGYLTSFPQYVMFVTRLHSDIDVYQNFLAATKAAGALDPAVLDSCRDVDYCLPPTMCYHTFHQFAGGPLPAGLSVVTARGKSFRHEEKYRQGLERLWDFTIREVVLLGTREQVLADRERLMNRVLGLVDELGLVGRCEVANDPFFGNTDGAVRSSSQRLLELKYELRLDVGEGKTIAVGSFNFHEQMFADAFALTDAAGETLYTACAGFGLERFAYALVCQYGPEVQAWPARARELLGY